MYTLVDLMEGSVQKFDTQRQLLSFWRWNIEAKVRNPVLIRNLAFDELNITGKDMHYVSGTYKENGFTLPCTEYRLGRYQVLDEWGRSCDIRTWTKAIQEVCAEVYPSWRTETSGQPEYQPRFRIDPVSRSRKRAHANRQYPSFTKQRLKDLRNKTDMDFEDDLLGFTPLRDHSKPRTLDWSYRKWKKSDNKCWKTQSRKRAQWERHMQSVPETRGPSREEEYDRLEKEVAEFQRLNEEIESELLEYYDDLFGVDDEYGEYDEDYAYDDFEYGAML